MPQVVAVVQEMVIPVPVVQQVLVVREMAGTLQQALVQVVAE